MWKNLLAQRGITVARASLSTFLRRRWRRRVERHEAAERGKSKPRNQRWIDFLRSTTVAARIASSADAHERSDATSPTFSFRLWMFERSKA